MKLKNNIVEQIKNVRTRRRIGERLDISDQQVYQLLRVNRENGVLTKITALKCIAEVVGLPIDEIIEESLELS